MIRSDWYYLKWICLLAFTTWILLGWIKRDSKIILPHNGQLIHTDIFNETRLNISKLLAKKKFEKNNKYVIDKDYKFAKTLKRENKVLFFEFKIPETSLICSNETEYLILIHTNLKHFEKRKILRSSWIKFANQSKVYFFIGTHLNEKLKLAIIKEAEEFKDIVQVNIIESYSNLALKSVAALHFKDTFCPSSKYLIKIDDDVILNFENLIKAVVQLKFTQWGILGLFYMMTADLIRPMIQVSEIIEIIPIEDVFITEKNKVVSVDLSGQGLTAIANSILERTEIERLNLSSNNLRALNSDVKKLVNITHLDLSRNTIKCSHAHDYGGLPAELAKLAHLEYLNIAECNFTIIPPTIWLLRRLKKLDLSRNKINVLPPDVGQLSGLQWFAIQHANLSTLPPEIALCQNLEHLILWGNAIDSLPETLKQMRRLKCLELNLRSCAAVIDDYMMKLLKDGKCESTHIPAVLFDIPALERLDLDEFPPVICTMKNIQSLDLSKNFLTTLPPALTDLSNLKLLNVNSNELEKLPTSICNLSRLNSLDISNNKLSILPENIGNLKRLKQLLCSKNRLQNLPFSICNLFKLHTLDISNNELSSLPNDMASLIGIKSAHSYRKLHIDGLWLHGNPLTQPPPQIWKTDDIQSIFDYMKRLKISETPNLQPLKTIILGNYQCGKTSFLNTMITGKGCKTTSITDSTEVLERTLWRTSNNVDFLFIEFGGHDVYETVLRHFMDKNALYIILYNHSTYQTENHYDHIGKYLDLIRTHAPGAVVKIIGAKSDEWRDISRMPEIVLKEVEMNLRDYEEKDKLRYEENIKNLKSLNCDKEYEKLRGIIEKPVNIIPGIVYTSVIDKVRNILDFVNELELIAINKELFPQNQRFVPQSWKLFRSDLSRKDNLFIEIDNARKLAENRGIKKDDFSSMLQHMQLSGDLLWPKKISSLENFLFHKPTDLVQKMRFLFRYNLDKFLDLGAECVWSAKGLFTEQTMEISRRAILEAGQLSWRAARCFFFHDKNLDSESELRTLLNILENFGFCYVIPPPRIPPPLSHFVPAVVVPSLNTIPNGNNPDWWCQGEDFKCMRIIFPLKPIPRSFFYFLACKVQALVELRSDTCLCIRARTIDQTFIKLEIQEDRKEFFFKLHGSEDVFTNLQSLILEAANYYEGIIYLVDYD
ncbi:DgyrCDS4293 [Dimorphilus gyrociliatus]|uniref:DgyrCDS4293 n=1 Tax=Dimorphilus gyrociliatus TaxID=2664684 RepID=A0A7I8VJ56_9ANNE|nr:DgyrCDS4293 [Dimorphilus gyrociliatus]